MKRTLSKLALGTSLILVALPSHVVAGRGGGGYSGGGNRGGGQMAGGSMGHSPSFSQARPQSSQSGSSGNHSQYGNQSSSNHNAGAAAAGAGYANHNQSSQYPHAGAAGAAAGAGYANHNQSSQYPHAGAAGAAAGAGYANNHNGTWNGNNSAGWGATGLGGGYASGVGAWGVGSPMYGWGYSGYSNPYSAGGFGSGGVAPNGAVQQPTAAPASDYSQPISTTAAPPEQAVAGQAASAYDQACAAFKAGDYSQAHELDQRALAQTPNDAAMHELLALTYFAQGKYPQAAAPLYAVLSVRPGWDWTTLSGMYPDVDTYTPQLRALEAYVRSNPNSAQARFVLAYQYLAQGHDPEAIAQLKEVVRLQPGDTLSAQIIAAFQPAGGNAPPPGESAPSAAPLATGKLAGTWAATPSQDAKISLTIQDDGAFTWTATAPGKPPMNISGKSTFADGTLTLSAQAGQTGALVGQVAWKDANDFTFRLVGGPSTDPGLKFAR
jgi:tetratricopeptide (TPR) repeat protein